MNYRLIVIGASLKDKSLLQKYTVLSKTEYQDGTSVSSTMYKMDIPEHEVAYVSNFLKITLKEPFYAHFYPSDPNVNILIVVFTGQVFKILSEAIAYGLAHGVTRQQMRITPTCVSEETW